MFLIKSIMLASFLSLLWWRNNIIIILLNLELLMISLFILISLFNFISSSIYLMILLTLMVSASTISLSILVALSRSFKSSNSSFLWTLMFDKIFHSFIYFNFSFF